MKIALLVHNLGRGGGQLAVVAQANGLARWGHSVTVVVEGEPLDLADDLDPDVRLARRGDIVDHRDVVLASWWRTALWASEIPADAYGQYVQSLEDRFAGPGERALRQWCAQVQFAGWPVITEARWIAETLAVVAPGQRCFLARNGIDPSIFPATPPVQRPDGQPLRVTVEGSSVWFKRTRQALQGVLAATVPIDLTYVAAWGDWVDDGLDLDRHLGRVRRLTDLTQRQVAEVFRGTDVLIKVPIVEGMPGPPLEAMHCGATVIASSVTGIEEYAVHGYNCALVGFDDPVAVGWWLDRLATDAILLARLRRGAFRTARVWPSSAETAAAFDRAVQQVRAIGYRPEPDSGPPARLVGPARVAAPPRPFDSEAALPEITPGRGTRAGFPRRLLRRFPALPKRRRAAVVDEEWRGATGSPHPLFDPDWYVGQSGRLLAADPYRHYLGVGFRAGLSPHPLIDAEWYWREYPDVAAHGVEPITHFSQYGVAEGRRFSGWLDAEFVRRNHPRLSDPAELLRFVMSELVPERRRTAPGQSAVLDIRDGRRMLAGLSRPTSAPSG
ncbi:MAG: glycosyltransferase [Candidatus Nanopelagicales bacterium]